MTRARPAHCARRARASGPCQKCLSLVGAFALVGCQQSLVVGESQVTPGGSKASDSSQTLGGQCPDAARLRAQDDACWPTEHVGRWHGFVTGDARYYVALGGPFVYPSGDVRLNVDLAGSGTLTFSPPQRLESAGLDAGLDAAPDAAAPDAAATPPLAAGLIEGFAYSLVDLSMSGSPSGEQRLDRWMQFSISLPEPLQVTLLLSADGAALRGTLSSPGPDGPSAAGLELIRE